MGTLYCLLSAAAFGAMAVFGKLAYDDGVAVDALLLIRFGIAGGLLLTVALARGSLRQLPRRTVLVGLGMGAFGYATQASLYFSALTRIDASLVALTLYVYPVLVMAGAIALRRERASRRRVFALVVGLIGIGLVLSEATSGQFDAFGVLFALGAAFTYAGYILVGDRVTADVAPLGLAALVCTGAFVMFLVAGAVRGGIDLGFAPAGWVWLVALALVSTVGAILLFFAGLARVGPSTASLLSTLEPVVTVAGAAAMFGETLSPVQWLGGLLVLGTVLIVQKPKRHVESAHATATSRRSPQVERSIAQVGSTSRSLRTGRTVSEAS